MEARISARVFSNLTAFTLNTNSLMTAPSLVKSAHVLASILGVIVKMSDDVKNAASPLDAQGKLLLMQKSIQNNAARIGPYVKTVLDELDKETK